MKCNWVATVSIHGQECNLQGSHWNVTKWDKQHISYKQQWGEKKKKSSIGCLKSKMDKVPRALSSFTGTSLNFLAAICYFEQPLKVTFHIK